MTTDRTLKEITPRSQDFSQWYLDVVLKAELADYGPVKGCMVIRPYGFALWENMQREMDTRFKELGHVNAYFPLFIPRSLLEREKEHVEGFSPEVAWVTKGGGEDLEEPLAIRPTSEVVICTMYSKWVNSWRDLPILINQWCNVVRWEKVTRPFLRTTEFLWQEGHTLHATQEEAEAETLQQLEVYRWFYEEVMAVPVIKGRKSDSEKFAGADKTYSVEALMGDGKALQGATSHNLGQNFAIAYDIEFLDRNQQRSRPWSTSWGASTRMIGGLIMTHGDDAGLILPPRIAPYQVVVVPIPPRKGDWNDDVLPAARNVQSVLRGAGLRVHLDERDTQQPGFKYADWEMRGVPLRLEIGPKDIEKQQCVLVRRDTREKEFVPLAVLATRAQELLDAIQKGLLERARKFLADNTTRVASYEQFKQVMAGQRGFLVAQWCRDAACEAAIQEETKATVRGIALEAAPSAGQCVRCGKPSPGEVYFAQAY
jgi:prolyl-tRNA synthetase